MFDRSCQGIAHVEMQKVATGMAVTIEQKGVVVEAIDDILPVSAQQSFY